MKLRSLVVLTLLSAALISAQESKPDEDIKNPLLGQPAAITEGKRLFVEGCSGCHGTNAEGGRGPNLAKGDLIRDVPNRRLFASIKSGIKGTEMPPSRLPDENIWQMVTYLRDLTSPAFDSHLSGDPEAGSALYFGKAGCVNCHMIRGRGGFLGPDLSNAGRGKTPPQLREAILDPDATIADGFRGVTVTTRDGKKITGVAKDNTNYAIQILDEHGEVHRLLKQDLREVVFRKKSLMPGDYKQRLSASELENLMVFLSRQSLRPAESKEASK
jgi:cytochrome c oxidase cbb3-type subunit 3